MKKAGDIVVFDNDRFIVKPYGDNVILVRLIDNKEMCHVYTVSHEKLEQLEYCKIFLRNEKIKKIFNNGI